MATTVANPGNIVVPLSQIIDQLQGKLSSSDIDKLLFDIISKRKDQVRPGDLITADLINQILADLQDLNAQIASLSVGGGGATANTQAVTTLHDAWSAYGALVKNGSFLPNGTTADAISSSAEITAYLQDVMYAALAGGSLAYIGSATALVDAFRRLYDKQHEVVVLFSAPLPGIPDTSTHRRFATLLNVGLEQDDISGTLALKKALDASNLTGAIASQNRINGIVRNQGGDVTTGNLQVTYHGAVGSTETLVIGSTQPVLYRFFVANKTNRSLDIQLKAEFLPPRQTWTQLSVLGLDGAARSSITVAPFDPSSSTNSGTQEVRVAAMTPAGAVDGDSGVLQLSAFVPDPINVRDTASRQLSVHNAAVQQTPGIVSFAAGAPILSGDLANAAELEPVTLTYQFAFSAGQGPSSRNFRFRLDISAPANPDSRFFFEFAPAAAVIDGSASTAVRKASLAMPMNDGDSRTVTATITPLPGSANSALTFTATIESATDGVIATIPSATISVTH